MHKCRTSFDRRWASVYYQGAREALRGYPQLRLLSATPAFHYAAVRHTARLVLSKYNGEAMRDDGCMAGHTVHINQERTELTGMSAAMKLRLSLDAE